MAIWVAIWGVLLLPATVDFLNGYLTDSFGCRIVAVVDGDTVKMHCPGSVGIRSGRLLGFDTPEIFSPRCVSETVQGTIAMWQLRLALWGADHIGVYRSGTDRYKRDLVRLTIDGADVAQRMVQAGFARPYSGGRRQGWCM